MDQTYCVRDAFTKAFGFIDTRIKEFESLRRIKFICSYYDIRLYIGNEAYNVKKGYPLIAIWFNGYIDEILDSCTDIDEYYGHAELVESIDDVMGLAIIALIDIRGDVIYVEV